MKKNWIGETMVQALTADEHKNLRTYQRQADRLRKCSIVQQGKVTFTYKTTIIFADGDGLGETQFGGYDKTAFQAAMPLLRQFMLEKDGISFFRIRSILYKCCDRTDCIPWIEYAKRDWKEALEKLPLKDHPFFHSANESVEKAINKLFYGYGGLFHANPDEPEEEESVREIQEAALQRAFPRLWNNIHILDNVIYYWLDKPKESMPPFPIKDVP